jgi:hypothetical protein
MVKDMNAGSSVLFRFHTASNALGTAITKLKQEASTVKLTVGPKRSPMSCKTGSPEKTDWPRFP